MKRGTMGRVGAMIALALALSGCSRADRKGSRVVDHEVGVRLVPDPVTVTTQVVAVVDVPGVDPAECRLAWFRNGTSIAGAHSNALMPNGFRKGERLGVQVVLPAAAGRELRTLRAETKVVNTPPLVRAVQVLADPSRGGSIPEANVELWDADGDPTTCSYRWFRNGQRIDEASSATLTAGTFGKDDRIEVEVVASDGEATSEPRRSAPFTFENRAPQFSAEPPSMSSDGKVLRVQVSASDPDGDALRFELAQAPAGATIDATGAVAWPLPAHDARPGEIHVTVRVSDGKGGEATQEFTIQLGAAAPALRPS